MSSILTPAFPWALSIVFLFSLLLYSFVYWFHCLICLFSSFVFFVAMFHQNSAYDLFNVNEDSILADDDNCSYYDTDDFNQVNNSLGDFSIFYLNTRSLCKHFFNVQDYLCSLNSSFTVYGFTETWFKETPPPFVHMNNYHLIHSSRCNRVGGGVALFISDRLNFIKRYDLMSSCEDFECVFIELQRDNACNLVVGNVYRAPGTSTDNFLRSFDTCLNKITNEKKLCYIMGDFNLDLTNSTHQPTEDFAYGLRPLINKPTRITPHSSTLIDNILINNNSNISVSGILYADISDHLPLFQITSGCFQGHYSSPNTTRDICSNTLLAFKADIEYTDWSEVYNCTDADTAYDTFLNHFTILYNHHFPLVTKAAGKGKKGQPWMSQGILNSCKYKHKLYKRYLRNPTMANDQKYKRFRNRLTQVIRVAKKNHYANRFSATKNNIKSTGVRSTTYWARKRRMIFPKISSTVSNLSLILPTSLMPSIYTFLVSGHHWRARFLPPMLILQIIYMIEIPLLFSLLPLILLKSLKLFKILIMLAVALMVFIPQ